MIFNFYIIIKLLSTNWIRFRQGLRSMLRFYSLHKKPNDRSVGWKPKCSSLNAGVTFNPLKALALVSIKLFLSCLSCFTFHICSTYNGRLFIHLNREMPENRAWGLKKRTFIERKLDLELYSFIFFQIKISLEYI